jgi:hypothetical protein
MAGMRHMAIRGPAQAGTRHPRGAVLAAALLGLLVVMLFTAAVARSLMLRRNAARLDERQLQCFFLAESAAARAIVRCESDAAYAGETWRIALGPPESSVQGVAEIRIEPVEGIADLKRIHIEARWPDVPVHRVTRRKSLTFTVQPVPDGTPSTLSHER